MRAVRLNAFTAIFPAVLAFSALLLAFPAPGQAQSVPDAPAPQAQSTPPDQTAPNAPAPQPSQLPDLKGQVAPGKSTTGPEDEAPPGVTPPQTSSGSTQAPQQAPPPDAVQQTPPETGPPGKEPYTITTGVTAVEVPVTVKDKHGREIPGLPWWRFKVYEDGIQQRIAFFTTDAYPLSIAFVIDATLPSDIMNKVNQSFSVVSNGLTPSDTVAVISYGGTGPQLMTDFTAAQGTRLTAALQMAKKPGEPMGVPQVGGPFGSGPTVNGLPADPNTVMQRGNMTDTINLPKEAHPLNDAILYAAEQLSSQPRGRRRVIYVISDGKNSRSKTSYKEVIEYLLHNNISVYGANVGDSAIWGIGYLDRMKIPMLRPEDVLPRYALATGGDVDHELSESGIQNAFVNISASVRTAYTLVYYSHQQAISGKYHVIDVHLAGLPGYQIDAKQGYYPSASEQ